MFGGGKQNAWIWALVAMLVVPPVSDFASWSYWRQKLQRQADHTAEVGALALRRGEAPVSAARARLARPRVALAEPATIEYPPAGGRYRGHAEAIRVRLTAERAPFFWSKLFGSARMTATGTVAVIPDHPTGTRIARVE
jgi:hypothetical protein